MPFGTGGSQYTLSARVESSGIGQFKSALAGATSAVGTFSKAVSGAGAAIGGTLVAGFGASVKAAAGFESKMNESLAIMGDVSDAMREDMSDAAREVAKTTRFSANEAAESFYYLSSAGLDAKQQIEALPQVADFAQAGMFDMATATDLATDAQSALGLTAEDAAENLDNLQRVTDTLVKANTLANASVEQFSQSLTNKAAASMRQANIEIEEGVSALATFADQGLKGQRAGTILARTIDGLQESAQKNSQAFADLGVSVYDAEGSMRPMADIVEDLEGGLAGMSDKQKSAALNQLGLNRRSARGIQLMMGNTEAMREYESQLKNAGGTTQTVAEKQLDDFHSQLGLLKDALIDIGIGIGTSLLKPLTTLVKRIRPAVGRIGEFVDGLSDAQVQAAAAGSVIATVAGTVGWFAGGPLGLAVAALGTLTYKMARHREEIQSYLLPVYEAIVEEVATTRESFRQLGAAAEPALRPIRSAVDRVSGAVETATGSVESDIQSGIIGTIRRAGRVVRGVLGQATAAFTEHGVAIGETITSTYTSARDTVSRGLGRIETLWNDHGGTVERRASTAYGKAKSTVDTALSTLQTEVLTPAFEKVEGLWDKHGGAVKGTISDIATSIKEDPVGAVRTALETIPGPLSKFGAAFVDTFDNIKENSIPRFESAISGIGDAVQRAADGNVSGALDSLNLAFEDTLSGTRIALVGEGGKGGIVGSMLEGMRGSLESAAGTIAKAAGKGLHKPIVTAIEQTATALIGGPDGSGEGLVDKFIGEIASFFKSDAWKQLSKAAGTMLAKGIRFVFEENFNTLMWNDKSIIKSLVTSFAEYIKTDALSDISEAFRILLDSAMAFFTGFYNELIGKSLIPDMFTEIADYIKNDAASDLLSAAKQAGEAIWNGIKDKFNSLMPNSLSVPGFDVGGQSVGIPNILGGGSVSVPRISSPGFNLDLPKLQTGGLIEDEGLAQLHEGELVVPAAQVDRDVGDGGGKSVTFNGDVVIQSDTEDPDAMADDLLAEVNARF